jgi:two-component system nitrogen regulation response regulator GlnG/two-component system response regulator HydG
MVRSPAPPTRTVPEQDLPWERRSRTERDVVALAIAWSLEEPSRVGEIALVHRDSILGRGPETEADTSPRLTFVRQRPGHNEARAPLGGSRISRQQLKVRSLDDGSLEVVSVGRIPLIVRGVEVKKSIVRPGDTITLKNALVLFVTTRPPKLPGSNGTVSMAFAFGAPDAFGVVGESAVAWRLREQLAFAAASPQHVLVQGPSGSGKELAARAIHGLSSRASKPIVARNAATFPEGLVDAELFGNAKNYPNSGSAERAGLIGEADGSVLFLDEIGELPPAMQAHLLRVLDSGSEYQRLGESKGRRSDFRLIAATNRDLDSLKQDFAARLTVRVTTPELADRREDIPLLIRALLVRRADEVAELRTRFFESDESGQLQPRLEPALVEGLVLHSYTHHLRELERLVWLAVSTSRDAYLARTPEVEAQLRITTSDDGEPTEGAVRAALAECENNVTNAAKRLGLKNRFALYRLMKRYGIEGGESTDDRA